MPKKKFDDLEVGAEFDLNIDADGWEPAYYKVTGTEAYQTHGSGAGLRKSFPPDAVVWPNDKVVQIYPDKITEVERAAITLLTQSPPYHPGLAAWVRAMASDPGEMRDLDSYIWEAELELADEQTVSLAEFLRSKGYECWEKEWDSRASAFKAVLDHKPRGKYAETSYQRRCNNCDEVSLRLADALQGYRVAGRPDGDQSHTVMGMGQPLLNVTTSLAAAICEYHVSMLDIAGRSEH